MAGDKEGREAGRGREGGKQGSRVVTWPPWSLAKHFTLNPNSGFCCWAFDFKLAWAFT